MVLKFRSEFVVFWLNVSFVRIIFFLNLFRYFVNGMVKLMYVVIMLMVMMVKYYLYCENKYVYIKLIFKKIGVI